MMLSSRLVWLADFHVIALALLAASLMIGSLTRQPAKRLVIAWVTTLGLVLLLGLATIPGWSLWSLGGRTSAAAPAFEIPSRAIAEPLHSPHTVPVLTGVDARAEAERAEPVAGLKAPESKSVSVVYKVPKLVLPLYICGAILATGWLSAGWWLARRIVGQAIEADLATKQVIESLTNTPPRLLISDRLAGPVAIGFVRPTILLPMRLIERSDEAELRTVLAHELAHVQGGDLWLLAGLRFLLVLLWCNPLYWLLRRRVRLDQETLADAAAVELSDRHTYAERLVGWARELTPQPQLAGSAGLWETPSQLRRRVAVLLDDGFTVLRGCSLRWRVTCAVACLTLTAVSSLVTLGPAVASESAPEAADGKQIAKASEGTFGEGLSANTWNPKHVLEFHTIHAETGEDLPGVFLELQNMGPGIDFEDITTYTTDSRGRAKIKLPARPPTAVRVYPYKTGFVPLRVYWEREPHPILPKSITVPMESGRPLGGRIQNKAGEPIVGATVSIHYWGPGTGKNPHIRANFNDESTETTTDAAGRWRFDSMPGNLDAEKLHIYVRHPDYVSDYRQRGYIPNPLIKQPALSQLYDETAVMTMQSGLTIEGLVIDSKGQPISNARIYDRQRMGSSAEDMRTTTDNDGHFRLVGVPERAFDSNSEYRHLSRNNRPEALTLTVQAAGFAAELVEVDQANEPLRIRLLPGKAVEGRVLDSDGKPLANVSIWPRAWRQYRDRLYIDAKTDGDGRFRLQGVPTDEVEYDFSKKGYLSTEGFSMKPSSDVYQITLREPVRIRGSVTDAQTGQPIREFTLTRGVDYQDGRAPSWMTWQQRELTTGEYVTELTQAGFSFRLRVDARGYLPDESRVFRAYDPDKGQLTYDFKLRKADRRAGTVLNLAGKPLANAKVYRARSRLNVTDRMVSYADQFDRPPAVTDSQGRFSFPPEVEPFCLVVAHAQGIGMITEEEFEQSGQIRIEPWNARNQQLQIIRRPTRGQLVDFPNPSPTSRLRENDNTPKPLIELGGDGIKIVPATIPGNDSPTAEQKQKYAIRVPASSLPRGTIGLGTGTPNMIAGRCMDGDGKPLAGVEMLLFHRKMHSGESKQLGSSETDMAGEFFFAKVVDDPKAVDDSPMAPAKDLYIVVARREGYASQSVDFAPSQIARHGVQMGLIFQPAGTLTGRVTDPNDKPVPGARVRATVGVGFDLGNQVFHAALTDSDGRYLIQDLPRGDFAAQRAQREQARLKDRDVVVFTENVTITHPEYAIRKQPLKRVPGELDIRLAPAATINGRIIHATGGSVEGLGVQIQTDKLSMDGDRMARVVQTAQVDSTGHYRFSSLPADDYYLQVDGIYNTELVYLSGQKVKAVAGESTAAPDLTVSEGRVVRFQLVHSKTKEPLKFETPISSFAWYSPTDVDPRYSGSISRQVKIGSNGQFEYRIDKRAVRMGVGPLPTQKPNEAPTQFDVEVAAGEVEQPVLFPIDL